MKKPSPELLELCGAVRDENADAAQVARLEELLAADAEAREFYLRFMQLEALLERYEISLSSSGAPPLRSRMPLWRSASLALAACLALSVLGYIFWRNALSHGDASPAALGAPSVLASVQEAADGTIASIDETAHRRATGQGLRAGEVLSTGKGSAVVRATDEETVFVLAPHTRVSLRRDGPNKVFRLDEGRFFCDVAEQHHGQRWQILTADGEAIVLGTRLSVSTGQGGTEVAVTSGLVRVTTRETRKSVETPAGYATQLTPAAAVLTRLPPDEPTRIASFSVVDADTGDVLPGFETLLTGATLNLGSLRHPRINIRANCEPRIVGGVRFAVQAVDARGKPVKLTHPQAVGFPKQTEVFFPYMVAGDPPTAGGPPLAPYPWTPPAGHYTLTATPYAGEKGKGARGSSLTVEFEVTAGPVDPTRP